MLINKTGNGSRQPYLHHATDGAGSSEDGSGIDAGGGVPVLSGEHERIKHAASTQRVGSHRGNLGRSGRWVRSQLRGLLTC